MAVIDEILAIKDWRHPYPIEGQVLEKETYRPWHPWRLQIDAPNLEAILGESLKGKRMLDVGCNDGWFSFEYEKLGAEMTGVDAKADANYRANLIKQYFSSQVKFLQGDLEDPKFIAENLNEPFDIVLFYGILYHLTDPINVLRKMGTLAKRGIAIQTWMFGEDRKPVLRFRKDEQHLAGSGTSFLVTAPSQSAIVAMLLNAGFDHVYRADPKPYLTPKFNPNTKPWWHFGFFYGIKGDPPENINAIKIDIDTPPINPFGPVSRVVDLGRRTAKRLLGKPLAGGF